VVTHVRDQCQVAVREGCGLEPEVFVEGGEAGVCVWPGGEAVPDVS
jgi:hypothetical protein